MCSRAYRPRETAAAVSRPTRPFHCLGLPTFGRSAIAPRSSIQTRIDRCLPRHSTPCARARTPPATSSPPSKVRPRRRSTIGSWACWSRSAGSRRWATSSGSRSAVCWAGFSGEATTCFACPRSTAGSGSRSTGPWTCSLRASSGCSLSVFSVSSRWSSVFRSPVSSSIFS